MKTTALIPIFILGSLSLSAGEKKEAFEMAFFEAVQTSDEAMFALVEFGEGTNPLFDQMLKDSLREERIKKIESVEFLLPDDDLIREFTYEGVEYTTTLPIEIRFKVTYEESEAKAQVTGTTYSLGTKGKIYKIVGTKPKE